MRRSQKLAVGMAATAAGGLAVLQRLLGPGLPLLQATSQSPSPKRGKKDKKKGKKGKGR